MTLLIRPPKILGFRKSLRVVLKTPSLLRKREISIPLKTRIGISREVELDGNISQHVLLNVLQSRRRLDIDQQLDKKIDSLKELFLGRLGIEKIKGERTRELMKILATFLAVDQNL